MSDASQPPSSPTVTEPASSVAPPQVQPAHTCWKEIGVYGNSSCLDLKKFIHCRNCGVFSQAARQLLDQSLPEGYRRQWTAYFSRSDTPVQPSKISAVVFRLQSEWLALPTNAFQEVAERRPIHSLPHRREGFVIGLVNVRGELLVCVALERFLGLQGWEAPERARASYSRLLVASWRGERVVFPVDEIHGIHRFAISDLREPPATVAKSNVGFARGVFLWRGKSVGFLDPALVFPTLGQNLS